MRAFLTYGDGIPRYIALWLPLMPALVGGLLILRVRPRAVAMVVATTLPTFFLHNPPLRLPYLARWVALEVVLLGFVWWVVRSLRGTPPTAARGAERAPWLALVGLAALAVAVRAPLAWLDPGISDIPRASEFAAGQLLAGLNPYVEANPHTVVGAYQYPAGSVLAHVPFVALLPAEVLGERWIPARMVLWVASAAAVFALGWAASAAVGRRASLAVGLVLALHPTLVRESGMVVANDVLLGLLVAGAAVALACRRSLWCAALVGLAISVKPSALVLVPLVALVAGWSAGALSVAVPGALQLPFLLLPSPGLHGLAAMAEPATRGDPWNVLQYSSWWPLYLAAPPSGLVLRAVTLLAIAAGSGTSLWAATRLRRTPPDLATTSLALALPLLATFLLGHRFRINFQDWYLVPFLVGVCVAGTSMPSRTVTWPPSPGHRRADTDAIVQT